MNTEEISKTLVNKLSKWDYIKWVSGLLLSGFLLGCLVTCLFFM